MDRRAKKKNRQPPFLRRRRLARLPLFIPGLTPSRRGAIEPADVLVGALSVWVAVAGAAIEPADAAAGSLTIPVTITGAATEAPDTVSGSAAVHPITVQGAITEPADAASGMAASIAAISGAVMEPRDTLGGVLSSDVMSITGAAVEPSDAVSGTLGVRSTVTGAATEQTDSIAGIIDSNFATITGAMTEPADTATGATAVQVAVTGAVLEPSDSMSGTVDTDVASITGAITEAPDAASGVLAVRLAVTGAATEAPDIASGAVSADVSTITGAVTEEADAVSGAAAVHIAVSGAMAEAPDSISGQATVSANAITGAMTEPADTASGTAAVQVALTGAATEPSDAASGALSAVGAITGATAETGDADGEIKITIPTSPEGAEGWQYRIDDGPWITVTPEAPDVQSASIAPSSGNVGDTFTASYTGTLGNPLGTPAYQWDLDGAPIGGAVAATYDAAAAGNLTVTVTIASDFASDSLTSSGVTVSGGGGGGGGAAIATLQDSFPGTAIDSAKWWTAGTVTVSGGFASISLTAAYDGGFGSQVTNWNLTDSQIHFGLSFTSYRNSMLAGISLSAGDNSNRMLFQIRDHLLTITLNNGSATETIIRDTNSYHTVGHRYLRIRESGGTIYFEYSHNKSSWNLYTSIQASTLNFAINSLSVNFFGGDWQGTAGTGRIDVVNV